MFFLVFVWFGVLDCYFVVYEILDSVVLVDVGVRIFVGYIGDFDLGREFGVEYWKFFVGYIFVFFGFFFGFFYFVYIFC